MTLDDAMRAACEAAGVKAPASAPAPGRWKRTDTLGKNGKGDASVMIFDDRRGGIIWNWQTQVKQPFRVDGDVDPSAMAAISRENEARRKREKAEASEAAKTAQCIVRTAIQDKHRYLKDKGFAEEIGLVHDRPHDQVPGGSLGAAMLRAMPEEGGPWLIVPGRVGRDLVTVQFIGQDGAKKNLLRGQMAGAAHRIATGAETWVCEGIATALTIRAALRLLGRSATVLCAFSASNAAAVAAAHGGAVLATDNDKAVEAFGGLGTGEYYARKSGRVWAMPPEAGDWNDHHQRQGLRSVALLLREVRG